jgi:hypothetical protein
MTWDYTTEQFAAQAKADPVWYLERLVNYGVPGHKINAALLAEHIDELKIPENRRAFLKLLLWNRN